MSLIKSPFARQFVSAKVLSIISLLTPNKKHFCARYLQLAPATNIDFPCPHFCFVFFSLLLFMLIFYVLCSLCLLNLIKKAWPSDFYHQTANNCHMQRQTVPIKSAFFYLKVFFLYPKTQQTQFSVFCLLLLCCLTLALVTKRLHLIIV